MKKKRTLVISFVLVLAVAAASTILVMFKPKVGVEENKAVSVDVGPCTSGSSNSIVSRATPMFSPDQQNPATADPKNSQKQFELEQEIVALQNHLNDPNCLHILAMININKTDQLQATRYIDLLEKGLANGSPFSYMLDENTNFLTISDMRRSVKAIILNEQQQKENDPFKGQDRSSERTDE